MKQFLLNPRTIFAATLAGAQLASADTLDLTPTDDSTIRASATNQGTNISLIVGDTTTATDYIRTALAFDLSNPVLTGATINSVTLTLTNRISDSSSQDAVVTIDLHQLSSSFTNSGVTWTSRDGTNNWTNPGGDFGAVLASISANAKTAVGGNTHVFSSAALTSTATSAVGGPLYLLAKLAVEDNANRNVFQFTASEFTTNPAWRPKLTIDYTPTGDSIPPAIVPPTVPADDATGVLVSTSLTATFSEPIALEAGGTITIDDLGAGPDTVITLPDARVSVTGGTNLVIAPASPLATNTNYAIKISSTAVKDLATPANFFAGISDTTTWNFQTAADGTPPALVSTTPADGATNVAPSTNLVAVFDETIVPGTGNIRIRNLTTGAPETVIPVGDSQVSISGSTLTIDPATDLHTADDYAIRIDAGALKDSTGNSFPGILDDTTWNFTMAGGKVLSAFDDRGDIAFGGPLNKTSTNDLGVGPISSGRFSRTYLTFDLTSASAATGDMTLVLSPAGSENNTSSVPQVFTLFVLASDWDGAAQPGPDGTAVATVNFTPQTGIDNRSIRFTSAALTTAFNNALGGNLYLGIKSDVEGPDSRSFVFLASREEPDFLGFEPRLNYFIAPGGDTFATWIAGKAGVGGQTAVGDDPDGDGNDNGVENFFGTEPGVFSTGILVGTVNPGAGTFTFTHPQGTLASDLTASYRWSTDLVTFRNSGASNGATTVTFSTSPDTPVAGTTTVTATVTGTPVQKLFVRVEVTQN